MNNDDMCCFLVPNKDSRKKIQFTKDTDDFSILATSGTHNAKPGRGKTLKPAHNFNMIY